MSRPLLLLIGGALAFWLLAGLPARMLGGGDQALVFSGAAVLLCLPPMAATLLWAGWVRDKAPADQMIMIAGSTGVRMAFVLGGGLALFLAVPYFQGQVAFWVWVLVVYLFTLALDVALMLAMRPSENLPSPRGEGSGVRGFRRGKHRPSPQPSPRGEGVFSRAVELMAVHEHVPNAFHHVLDAKRWEFFDRLFGGPVEWNLPAIPLPWGGSFQFTKFMMLELIAAGLILLIYIPLARRATTGELPKGWRWNMFESLLTFVRNEIARPNLGGHHPEEADQYVPFLWTLFLFILFCNLLGMFPFGGSPTSSIYMTGGLAIVAFFMIHGCAIAKMGPIHYVKSLWPHIDVPYVGWMFSLMIFTIELAGSFIKSGVLAVRLFANMFAGHLVLAFLIFFIFLAGQVGNPYLWGGVTIASVLGVAALSLLELFVAFLQTYVFVFLTALFMGMALHPEH